MSYWMQSFPGIPEQVSEVRSALRRLLRDAPGSEDVITIAAELAANAIKHSASGGPGGTFSVEFAAYFGHWQIRVQDAGGLTMPCMLDVDESAEEGRGLAMINALAKQWQVLGGYGAPCAVLVDISKPSA